MSEFNELLDVYDSIIFFDTETTGLEPESCYITELAAVQMTRDESGEDQISKTDDSFILLPAGEHISEEVVELTGITDELLQEEGKPEKEVMDNFTSMFGKNTLLVAYNAQFDLSFIKEAFKRVYGRDNDKFQNVHCLDAFSVYRERKPYCEITNDKGDALGQKLAAAIINYDLADKVQNSHRAIDDTLALVEVCRQMQNERPDLYEYVDVFGYNPKYVDELTPFTNIEILYFPQSYIDEILPEEERIASKTELDRVFIYQLSKKNREYSFMPYSYVSDAVGDICVTDYDCVYSGFLGKDSSLEDIFEWFNIDIPDGFKGHSLSVGDVIGTERDGIRRAYYVDSFGFKELSDFYTADYVVLPEYSQLSLDDYEK